MSQTINFPNDRLEVAGTDNPLFVTDIANATNSILSAMKYLSGLGDTDFAIIYGFEYSAGTYSAGLVYMNGVFYWVNAGVAENKYLAPSNVDGFVKIFEDTNTHATYRTYYAIQSNTQVGGMPQLVGSMDAYRLNLTKIKATAGLTKAKTIFFAPVTLLTGGGGWQAVDISSYIGGAYDGKVKVFLNGTVADAYDYAAAYSREHGKSGGTYEAGIQTMDHMRYRYLLSSAWNHYEGLSYEVAVKGGFIEVNILNFVSFAFGLSGQATINY